jgi:hypothetical protein
MTSGKEAAVSCGLSASGAAGGQAKSVELFDGELAGDAITGDGEAAAEAGAELDQERIVVVLLHGQVDGFAATQGFADLYVFHGRVVMVGIILPVDLVIETKLMRLHMMLYSPSYNIYLIFFKSHIFHPIKSNVPGI